MPTTIITIATNLQINSESLAKFIKSVSIRNKNTAKQYYSRLLFFARFAQEQYNNKISIDNLVKKLKNGKLDPYDILNDYCIFLQNNYNNIGSVTEIKLQQ